MGFKPNYFMGFGRKFYPNFNCFYRFYDTEILRYVDFFLFRIKISFIYLSNWGRIFWQFQ